MRRKIVIPAVLLIVVLAGSGAFAFLHESASKNSAAPPASPPVPIVAGTVAQHDVPIYLTGVGRTFPRLRRRRATFPFPPPVRRRRSLCSSRIFPMTDPPWPST